MTSFLTLQKERRSIYTLGKQVSLSHEEIANLIQQAVEQTPTAFHSQTSRIVILFGEESENFWNTLVANELEKVTSKEVFAGTKEKLNQFSKGVGTILFFEDQAVVEQLQTQFPLYADNFPLWSEQGHGIALYATWLALAEQKIGMNVQHYNPLIDQAVKEKYAIPANWLLRAQAPFGSIEASAAEKVIQSEDRFKVFGN